MNRPSLQNFRLLAFLLPALVGSAVWWWTAERLIHGQFHILSISLTSISGLALLALLAFGLWVGSALLIGLVVKTVWECAFVAVIVALPMVFVGPWHLWIGAAYLTSVVGLWWGINHVRRELDVSTRLRPATTISRSASWTVLVLTLALSMVYYQQLQASGPTPTAIADTFVNQTVSVVERFLPRVYPSYRSTATVDEFLADQIPTTDSLLRDLNLPNAGQLGVYADQVTKRLADAGLSNQVQSISPTQTLEEVRQRLNVELQTSRQKIIAQTRKDLADRLGLTLTGQETLHTVISDVVGQQFNRSFRNKVQFVPPLLALAFFFIIRLLNFLFVAVTAMFAGIIFHLLHWWKIILVEESTTPVERARLAD